MKDTLYKTRELIVHLAERSSDDPQFGRVKLTELLFRCDFAAYAQFGSPLTSATYRRGPNGPLADEQPQALRELGEAGALSITGRVEAHRQADTGWLDADQLRLVGEVVQRHRADDDIVLRCLSEAFPGYALAAAGETLPYHTVFVSRESPAPEDLDWARSVAGELQEA